MRIRITQYGYTGDSTPDAGTECGLGCYGNPLTKYSCALTDSAKSLFNAKQGEMFNFVFTLTDGSFRIEKRYYHDRCPNYPEPRFDFYNPAGFDGQLPDFAEVVKHESV